MLRNILYDNKPASTCWALISATIQKPTLFRTCRANKSTSNVETIVLEQFLPNVSTPTMTCCQQLQVEPFPNVGPTIAYYLGYKLYINRLNFYKRKSCIWKQNSPLFEQVHSLYSRMHCASFGQNNVVNVFRQCYDYLTLAKSIACHLKKNWIPFTHRCFVPKIVETDPIFSNRSIFRSP